MNYRTEAIDVLLNEDCVLQRYFPLIPYKEMLVEKLIENNCRSKAECMELTDEALNGMGLPDAEAVRLFRNFLVMYDVKESKFKDIGEMAASDAEAVSFRELYLLPGVKAVRAKLYYEAGYRSLRSIASASPEQIIRDTSEAIRERRLKAPLPKEARTHIAVAKALTVYAVRCTADFKSGTNGSSLTT